MGFVAVILVVALLIPLFAIVLDSPMGRALGRRFEGPNAEPPALKQLAQKVDLLEAEMDDLTRNVAALREENAFLQRLLADGDERRTLPPPTTP